MKAFAVLAVLFVSAQAQEFCYKDATRACIPSENKQASTNLENCNARYGAINDIVGDLQAFVNTHIARSFEYLLMSTHYANYQKNRPGFEKLFRGLSDDKWEDAIDLIKYITKRGGMMDFNNRKKDTVNPEEKGIYELYELQAIAKALDMEKQLATETHNIHRAATRRREENHDPEISSYLEKEFVHKQAGNIRKLSGYTTDLKSLLNGPDSSLSLFLFDEYLNKQ